MPFPTSTLARSSSRTPAKSRPTPPEENDYVQVQARRCRAVGHGHVWSAGFLSARTGRRRHRLECHHDGCSHDHAPGSAGHARRCTGPCRHARRHSVDREEVRAVSLPAQGCEGLAHGCGGCRGARRARQHLSDPGHHGRCEVLRLSRPARSERRSGTGRRREGRSQHRAVAARDAESGGPAVRRLERDRQVASDRVLHRHPAGSAVVLADGDPVARQHRRRSRSPATAASASARRLH